MGILGTPIMGGLQDLGISKDLQANQPAIFAKVAGEPKEVVFLGEVRSLDEDKVSALSDAEKELLMKTKYPHKKAAFYQVATLPCFMLLCYISLFLYFRSKGGYKPQELAIES